MTTLTSPALVAKICDRAEQTADVRPKAVARYVEYVAREAAARGVVVDLAELTAAVDARWRQAAD